MSEKLHTDIAVVGAGIAGLWSAKELVDRGYDVTVIEKSLALADGATTRNEGWLHAGTYHSVAVEDNDEISQVVENTRFGHQAIIDFAPEAIDHATTYAVASQSAFVDRATSRWLEAGVPFREISMDRLREEGLDVSRLRAAFEVDDKSVNSRLLCERLAEYIRDRGGTFLTGAVFVPEDDQRATVLRDDEALSLAADKFLITAGVGMQSLVEQIRGVPLAMRFFKAHLLVTPRLTEHNYFHLEPGEAGFMNHGQASAIGINRDGVELAEPDYNASLEKERLIYGAVSRLVPHASLYRPHADRVLTVVCNKPDIREGAGATQSLDVHLLQASPNYLCALPGKMTTAPHLGRLVADTLTQGSLTIPAQGKSPEGMPCPVTPRPLDHWRDLPFGNESLQYGN